MLRSSRTAGVAVLLLAAAACQDAGVTSPSEQTAPTGASQFSEQLSLPDLKQSASATAVRIEVKLRSDAAPLIASEVERSDSAAAGEPEKVEGRVASASEQGLTLALGGLRVGFDAATRFRSESGDTLSQAEFVSRLQAALTAGGRPAVEARRPAPSSPQAPEDGSFVASELEIDDEASEPKLELNIDADNLQLAADSTAGGTLKVLGLTIEIRARETEVESRRPGKQARAKFEGIVASADAAAGSVTLKDGRVIRVVQGTEIESKRGKLRTIAEVAAALAAGQIVEAEGKGVHEGPTTLLAVEVEFEVEEDADDVPNPARLKDVVASVDVPNRSFTLTGGQVVRLVDGTRIKGDGIATLQQLADAVTAQRTVRAEGKLLLESAGPPARYVALEVKFKTNEGKRDEAPGLGRIEGRVAKADAAAGTLTLASGVLVRVAAATVFDTAGDLRTLQALAEALTAGRVVTVHGEGTLESAGPPRVVVASKLRLQTRGAGDDDDDGDDDEQKGVKLDAEVASVDVAGRKLTLSDGRVVRVTDDTRIQGNVRTLQQAADALLAGRKVKAEGRATVEAAGPPAILVARQLKLKID